MRARAIRPIPAPPDVTLALPGSKSITNRALLAAAMADGESVLERFLVADDTLAMVECVRRLGATVELDRAAQRASIVGCGGRLPAGEVSLDVRQSGVTARFMVPLVAAGDGTYTIDGHEQMRGRPQEDLLAALANAGVRVEPLERPGRLPVRLQGGHAPRGRVAVSGAVSSQFASALLLAAPLYPAGLTVEVVGQSVSAPYLTMTLAVMEQFGATIETDGGGLFHVAPGGYRASTMEIEPDASAASYFFGAAAITEGRVCIPGLGRGSLQGDLAFVDVLADMGAEVEVGASETTVVGTGALAGVEADLRGFSDTAPTLAVVAAYATGSTRIEGIGFIRGKESDRIAAIVTELQRCGVGATAGDDGLTVVPSAVVPAEVQTYEDHRIAMAFSLLGLRTDGISIADPGCVAKTFPEYWEMLDRLWASGLPTPTVVALDGPAGSGKSTVAKALARRLNIPYLDTGAMYRAVTYAALSRGVPLDDADAVAEVARLAEIEIGPPVMVDGHDASAAIRGPAVTAAVSGVAANSGVRTVLRERQRQWARALGGGVMEGRDIGTVVFPDAKLKVFLTASPEERARRRAAETGEDVEAVLEDIKRRDGVDSTRDDSPLAEAVDAVLVDTTGYSVDEVVERIASML